MSNFKNRVGLIQSALEFKNLAFTFVNDLMDEQTTFMVESDEGLIEITIRHPGLSKPAFLIRKEKLMFSLHKDSVLDLIERLKPFVHNNVVRIK